MRFTALVILGFLVGCVGAPEEEPETDSIVHDAPDGERSDWYEEDRGPSTGCGSAVEIVSVDGPNGEIYSVEVPIPCDPYYFDKGDPPPDEEVIDDDDMVKLPAQAMSLQEQPTT